MDRREINSESGRWYRRRNMEDFPHGGGGGTDDDGNYLGGS